MSTSSIRLPAVAGTFYPAQANALRVEVASYLPSHPKITRPKALIAPHAGFIYSGPIAGSAYATLAHMPNAISRVVLLGPSHRVGFRGIATSSATAFRTPLGDLSVDQQVNQQLNRLPHVISFDLAHRDEHGIEVQLPFLQIVLQKTFSIVPLVVGDALGSEVAAVLDLVWGGDETLIVISSDLSHYLSYADAVTLDRQTTESILQLAPEKIGPDQACGRVPIQGLLIAAKKRGLSAHVLDQRNSGDTAGDRSRVVGYGAYAFTYGT